MAAAWPGRSSSSVTWIAARPAAQASGLPPNVVEWMIGLGIITSQTVGFAMNAESGMTPPPSDLPRHMMSGTTFQWSTPHSLPVRPMPVWISSAMSSAPYLVHAARARGR